MQTAIAIGDSNTLAYWMSEEERWIYQVCDHFHFDYINAAQNGAASTLWLPQGTYWRDFVEPYLPVKHAFIMLGSADILLDPKTSLPNYIFNITQMIWAFRNNAECRVHILTPCDWDRGGILLAYYGAWLIRLAGMMKKVYVVSNTYKLLTHPDYFTDEIHWNALGHTKVANDVIANMEIE